jgi:hypothetical protein
MKSRVLFVFGLTILFGSATAIADEPPRAAVAWFTDAAIAESVQVAAPESSLPTATGGLGDAVRLTKAVPVQDPVLFRKQGYISFWLRPDWDGNDGKVHRILRIGDPERNGLLVEKSASTNMLRYVMASPEKLTVARTDVSGWKAGEWHHIAIAWMTNRDGVPTGVPLWIDRVAVDGPIASGNTFLDPDAMDDARVWIGDETSDAAMDELVMRYGPTTERSRAPLELVYRDYFRTAPYSKIAINTEPHAVRADQRVVEGGFKQFGLLGWLNGRWERMTEYIQDHGYGTWAGFDAKPLITWKTSDEAIATVDDTGKVTGHALGRCTLTAEFRGLTASHRFEVISPDQPDLDLYVVERHPRYHKFSLKKHPEPGDVVKSVARVANFGYEPTPARVPVTLELIPDSNGNYQLDADERPILRKEAMIENAIEPHGETTVEFEWTWPDVPVWVRVTVDPHNRVREICEANNQLTELNTAKPVIWGYVDEVVKGDYEGKRLNIVGSFSTYDWIRAQSDRLRVAMREAIYPTTSPAGILEDIRVDEFIDFIPHTGPDRPYEHHMEYQDGGFPIGKDDCNHLSAIWTPVIHELGHTMLALPDLYGHPCMVRNVFITDENGKPYAGGPLMPTMGRGDATLSSPAQGVECGVSYPYLMDYCHLHFNPAHAGQIQYYHGCRGPHFWGVQGRLIPTSRNELLVLDLNDEPLVGAAVYCYHTTHVDGAEDSGSKFFADRPKFTGNTNENGRFVFPDQTDRDWDSPETDEADGAIDVWNPFGVATEDTAGTPNCWGAEGMMLLKIVSGDETEFHWLTLTMMNEAFFEGAKNYGIYTVRTSLKPCAETTRVVRKPVPEAIRKQNLAPVAKIAGERRITVKPGEMIRLDGSGSTDPEGQPLQYRWLVLGPVDREYRFSDKPVYEGAAPSNPRRARDYRILFHVIDGVRTSEVVTVRVRVVGENDEEAADTD